VATELVVLACCEFRFRRKYGTFGAKFTKIRSKLRCVKNRKVFCEDKTFQKSKDSVKLRGVKSGQCEYTYLPHIVAITTGGERHVLRVPALSKHGFERATARTASRSLSSFCEPNHRRRNDQTRVGQHWATQRFPGGVRAALQANPGDCHHLLHAACTPLRVPKRVCALGARARRLVGSGEAGAPRLCAHRHEKTRNLCDEPHGSPTRRRRSEGGSARDAPILLFTLHLVFLGARHEPPSTWLSERPH
jgi:hypothetical protein